MRRVPGVRFRPRTASMQVCSSHTWTLGRCFGLFSKPMVRREIPIAPEETRTTRWPSLRSSTAVSTIEERVDSSGLWLFSSTIELVPTPDLNSSSFHVFLMVRTQLDDHSQVLLAFHRSSVWISSSHDSRHPSICHHYDGMLSECREFDSVGVLFVIGSETLGLE